MEPWEMICRWIVARVLAPPELANAASALEFLATSLVTVTEIKLSPLNLLGAPAGAGAMAGTDSPSKPSLKPPEKPPEWSDEKLSLPPPASIQVRNIAITTAVTAAMISQDFLLMGRFRPFDIVEVGE
jgi:hypothetical protein